MPPRVWFGWLAPFTEVISAPVPTSCPSGRTYIWFAVSSVEAATVVVDSSALPDAAVAGLSVLHAMSGLRPIVWTALVSHTFLPENVPAVTPVVPVLPMHMMR